MATFTIHDLCDWYDQFNSKYFNNELTRCPIHINKTRRALGQFCRRTDGLVTRFYINISNYLDRPIKAVQTTLIHEMIHQWQWVNFRDTGHGVTFKHKSMEINKDGWTISRCSSTIGCEVREVYSRKKIYNVCIFKKNGRYGKAVLASNKVEEFKKWIPTIDGISEIYFGFSNDKKLAKYTCSRTRLTWYYIDESEYNFLTTKFKPLVKKVA